MIVEREIRVGWTGKLPCRGDFVRGGAQLDVFEWFERWASHGMVAIRDGGGPAADAFLTSDLRRVAASSGLLSRSAVMAVIGPGMDRAARLYPFMLALEVPDDIAPAETLEACRDWYEHSEELFLAALAPDFDLASLGVMVDALPSLAPVPSAGVGRVFAHQVLGCAPVLEGSAPAVEAFFSEELIAQETAVSRRPMI